MWLTRQLTLSTDKWITNLAWLTGVEYTQEMLSPGFNIITEKDKFYGIMDAYSLDENHLPLFHEDLSPEVVANFIRRVHQDKTPGAWIWDNNQRPINSMSTQLQVVKKLLRANVRYTKDYAKKTIEQYKDNLNRLAAVKRITVSQLDRDMYEDLIHDLSEEMNNWSTVLKSFSYKKSNDSLITEQDVINAKMYPVTDLIKFNSQNFAKCPWHNEKSPSLKLYKQTNTVHCFGCGKSGDTIEVARSLFGESFIQAVKRLTNK